MHLEVTFRNLNPRDEVRTRAEALFAKMEKFLDPAAQAHMIVSVEHGMACVEVVLTSRGTTHKVAEEDAELRASLDRAMHSLEYQLRRAKEKRTNRKGRPDVAEVAGGEEAGPDEETPTV
jgi:ribosomal subunit interface protein